MAAEQSSRNSGWVRQTGRDVREMPLMLESMRQWRGINERTGAETGFRERGVLYVGASADDEARFQAWIDAVGDFDVGATLVRGGQLAQLMRGTTTQFRCGLYVASDGCAEPHKAAPAIARAAQARGAILLEHCAVRGIERAAGRVSGVVTEHGSIACNAVILAGGAWSSRFCAGLDIALPQLKILISLFRTGPVPQGPEAAAWLSNLGYRKRLDGGYTINAASGFSVTLVPDSFRFLPDFLPLLRREWKTFRPQINTQSLVELRHPRDQRVDRPGVYERVRILDPTPDRALNTGVMHSMRELNPQFHGVRILQEWAGYIDVTPDMTPCIDVVDHIPGMVVATGFSGHGFGIGPGAGRVSAELALADTPCVDINPFRLSRFRDGSPLVVGTEI